MFEIKAFEIKEILGGELVGSPDLILTDLNRIEHVSDNQISFVSERKYFDLLNHKAGLLIVNSDLELNDNLADCFLRVENAYLTFVKLLKLIEEKFLKKASKISQTAVISESSTIGKKPLIMDNAFIGENCIIGNNVVIHPNVSILDRTEIGDNCIIHSGAVIGSDGFGYAENKDGSYTKIPQLGNVKIGNNCEIGANTCIDRAVAGSTIISDGVKLDNLIHIAHNVEIGENSAFASQVGISGSVKIGKRVKMGGQSGSAGHLEICDDVTILAQSGVPRSVEKKGVYFGSPIKERLEAFKIEASLKSLPDALKELKKLSKKVESS